MATQVNANNLVKFYTGTALPAHPVENHIYFIIGEEAYGENGEQKKPVGQIYKGSQLVAEINDDLKIAEIEAAINALDEKLSKEIDDHIKLYEALVKLVEGHGTRLTTAEGKLTTLIGEDANKSVRTIANEELVKQLIPENATEALDTLQEIAAWIQAHPGDAAAMNKAIEDLETLVGTLPEGITATNVTGYIAEVKTALEQSISTEQARAEAAEKANADAIAAEAERAAAAEKVNADAIAAETARAEAAEKDLKAAADTLKGRVDAFDKILDDDGSVTQAIAEMAIELKAYADQAEADAIKTSKEYTDAEIDKVEGTISGIQAVIETLAKDSDLDALEGRVATAEGEIDALQGLTEQHTTQIGELNDNMGVVANLTTEAKTVVGAINENAADIATNATNIANNVSDIALLYDALQWHQIGE